MLSLTQGVVLAWRSAPAQNTPWTKLRIITTRHSLYTLIKFSIFTSRHSAWHLVVLPGTPHLVERVCKLRQKDLTDCILFRRPIKWNCSDPLELRRVGCEYFFLGHSINQVGWLVVVCTGIVSLTPLEYHFLLIWSSGCRRYGPGTAWNTRRWSLAQ